MRPHTHAQRERESAILMSAARGEDGGTALTVVCLQHRASLQYRAGDSPRQDEARRLISVRNGVCKVVETGASSVVETEQTKPAGRVRAREGVACPFLDCVEEESAILECRLCTARNRQWLDMDAKPTHRKTAFHVAGTRHRSTAGASAIPGRLHRAKSQVCVQA